jgi:hypothetical protein
MDESRSLILFAARAIYGRFIKQNSGNRPNRGTSSIPLRCWAGNDNT